MKLATFSAAAGPRIGLVHGADELLFDLAAAAERDGNPEPRFRSMIALMHGGAAALDRARTLFEKHRDDAALNVKIVPGLLLSPVPVPRSIRDFSSFPEHLKNAPRGMRRLIARLKGEPPPDLPPATDVPEINKRRMLFYKGNTQTVIGTDATVRRPSYSKYMDYELECGAFIGKRGVNIRRDKVHEHIFGYALFNDFSARDEQSIEMAAGFGPGKGTDFDTGNAIGPWIVTADAMPEPYRMRMMAKVNGEVWSDTTMADGLYTFADLISFASGDETLRPGEFIAAGTVSTAAWSATAISRMATSSNYRWKGSAHCVTNSSAAEKNRERDYIMDIVVFASFAPKPGKEAEVEKILRGMVAPVRAEPGCRVYDLYKDAQGGFHLFERYADQAAVEAHRGTAHYKAYRAAIADLLAEPISVKLLSGLDVRGG